MKARERMRRYAGQSAFAGVAVAMAVSGWLLLEAGSWGFREFTAQLSTYRRYSGLQRDAGKADSLSASYAALAVNLAKIRQGLPPENRSSHVLNVLVKEARSGSLALSGVIALDEIPFPDYTEIPFELGITGKFPDLLRYLGTLESQGMILQVRRLTLQNELLNKSDIKAQLDLSVFIPKRGAIP